MIDDNQVNYQVYYDLGVLYARGRNYSFSEKYLKLAVGLQESQAIDEYNVYNSLGWVQFSLFKYEDAETNYKHGIANKEFNSTSLNSKLFTNLGLLFYIKGSVGESRKYLEIAIKEYGSKTAQEIMANLEVLEVNRQSDFLKRNISLSIEDGEYIGQKVWLNEGSGRVDNLISWNEGEGHVSMGIGHFIWYPLDSVKEFEETFPRFINFISQSGVELPRWLTAESPAQWPNRMSLLKSKELNDEKYFELKKILENTIPLQVDFLISRLNQALPKMLETILEETRRSKIKKQYYRLARTGTGEVSKAGVFALLDYVNFKGEGVKLTERYNNEGWGLLQVLEGMSNDSNDPVNEFVISAKNVLSRRIRNSPAGKNEDKWKVGWFNRLDTYKKA
jgi:hypothetical protein